MVNNGGSITGRFVSDRSNIEEIPLPRVRCRYQIVTPRPAPNIVAILDISDDELFVMSVTNDAEAVVTQLIALGVLRPGDRLVYRDSFGLWDEIVVSDGKVTGFTVMGAKTLERAVQLCSES